MRESTETEAHRAFYAHLTQAENDIRLGRVQDMDECFDELLRESDRVDMRWCAEHRQ